MKAVDGGATREDQTVGTQAFKTDKQKKSFGLKAGINK